jgi:hypothetical protein
VATEYTYATSAEPDQSADIDTNVVGTMFELSEIGLHSQVRCIMFYHEITIELTWLTGHG